MARAQSPWQFADGAQPVPAYSCRRQLLLLLLLEGPPTHPASQRAAAYSSFDLRTVIRFARARNSSSVLLTSCTTSTRVTANDSRRPIEILRRRSRRGNYRSLPIENQPTINPPPLSFKYCTKKIRRSALVIEIHTRPV